MATSKKRNKKYVPKKINTLPAIFGFDNSDEHRLKTIAYIAFDKLKQGTGTDNDWTDIVARLLTGRELVMAYVKEEDIKAAVHEGLRTVVDIGIKRDADPTGKWSVSEKENEVIIEALGLIDNVQDLITCKEYEAVREKTMKINLAEVFTQNIPWEEYKNKVASQQPVVKKNKPG